VYHPETAAVFELADFEGEDHRVVVEVGRGDQVIIGREGI